MKPILTVLSYSGGVQSHALLEMVLRGHIERPDPFLVMNADPGMENSLSYEFVEHSRERCRQAGIDFHTAEGPNLLKDLLTFKERGATRIDNPPYWTKNRITGKRGKMRQKCTGVYKLQPMRRQIRVFMHVRLGVSLVTRNPPPIDTWIGFAMDESQRCSKSDVKYVQLRFPLIELGMDRAKVEGYYLKHGIRKPPRSVCNACFANGLAYFEDMYFHRPADWVQAVTVDEAIRDMTSVGVKDEVFVSSSLVPLRDLPDMDFKKDQPDYKEHRCNSGVCFL